MPKVIDSNKYYDILDELFVCCDEHQFRHVCKKHRERQGCSFCAFDPYGPCDC
jgi:hypothetical protein